jgi:hypothetical protein
LHSSSRRAAGERFGDAAAVTIPGVSGVADDRDRSRLAHERRDCEMLAFGDEHGEAANWRLPCIHAGGESPLASRSSDKGRSVVDALWPQRQGVLGVAPALIVAMVPR